VNFQDILSTIANIYTTKQYQKSIPNGLCTLKVFWSHTCHEHKSPVWHFPKFLSSCEYKEIVYHFFFLMALKKELVQHAKQNQFD